MSPSVIIEKNFLTKKECEFERRYFQQQEYKYGQSHQGTRVLAFDRLPFYHFRILSLRRRFCKDVLKRVSFLKLNYDQIVKWGPGTFRDLHYDNVQVGYYPAWDNQWVSVCYLNDNFEGGKTMIEDEMITPQQGKVVIFNSRNLLHGVSRLQTGFRYVHIAWWQEN